MVQSPLPTTASSRRQQVITQKQIHSSQVTARGATTTEILSVSGLTASVNISASAYYGDGSNLSGISAASTLDEVTDNGSTTTNGITVGSLTASAGVASSAIAIIS